MSESQKDKDVEVSFTDTNAETGMTAGDNKVSSSRMQDLIGQLKSQDKQPSKMESDNEKSGKKKKNKKKKVRGEDRFESQNYLFRIEGSICCASIFLIILWIFLTAILLIVIITVTKGDLHHMFMKEKIQR